MPDRDSDPGQSSTEGCLFLLYQELTPRERQCLELAAVGLTYRQIGRRMYISATTVKNHLVAARRKLRAENTAHAVAKIVTYNLIEFDAFTE